MTMMFLLKPAAWMPPSPHPESFKRRSKKRNRNKFQTIQEIQEGKILKRRDDEELLFLWLNDFNSFDD